MGRSFAAGSIQISVPEGKGTSEDAGEDAEDACEEAVWVWYGEERWAIRLLFVFCGMAEPRESSFDFDDDERGQAEE